MDWHRKKRMIPFTIFYPWYDISIHSTIGLQKWMEEVDILWQTSKDNRAAASPQKIWKRLKKDWVEVSSLFGCVFVLLSLELRQFGRFFASSQWQDWLLISQICCAWKLDESWYIAAIVDQLMGCTVAKRIQRGYWHDRAKGQGAGNIRDEHDSDVLCWDPSADTTFGWTRKTETKPCN